jgi:protein-tyrosine phosphatase
MKNTRKRFISCILCAALLTGSLTALPVFADASAEIQLGDVNADSSVNAKDAAEVLIAAAVVGTGAENPLTDAQKTAADVNKDGKTNANDAGAILAFAAYSGTGGTETAAEYFAHPTQKLIYSEQVLSDLRGVSNARQMGGYINRDGKVIKQNVLIRSGSLAHATDSAKDALVNKYHVTDVMDFRYERELNEKTVDPEIEGITHHTIAMSPTGHIGKYFAEHPEDSAKLGKLQQQAGKTGDSTELSIFQAEIGMITVDSFIKYFESDEAAEGYKGAFEVLLNKPEDAAVLFHCSAGKDRTGMIAMLLLSALDFDRDLIVQDYMLSNEANAANIEKLEAAAKAYTDDEKLRYDIMYTQCVYPEVIETIMDDLTAEYGSVKDYLRKKIGLTDADFAKLEALYLEEQAK